jgi:hypothetical protein
MLNDVVTAGRVRARDMILAGPRGVGKTVTVSTFARQAQERGFEVVALQAAAGRAGLVDALIQRAHSRIHAGAGPWQRARAVLERISGASLSVAGVGASISTHASAPQVGAGPDATSLAEALATVADEICKDSPTGGLLITIDEMQVAPASDLVLLAAALHRLNVDHPRATVLFAGTGLPTTSEVLRQAGVTHPDRLFVLEPIPLTLEPDDARHAVVEPAQRFGVTWTADAASAVVEAANGYPAHVQLFADVIWTRSPGPDLITLDDVHAGLSVAADELERRTFGPRWTRMTERQMEFLAALAFLDGRASMAMIASTLGRDRSELSWLRDALIGEGDVYAPSRGQLALTVPLFSRFILGHYEAARAESSIALLSLEQMGSNLAPAPKPVVADDTQATTISELRASGVSEEDIEAWLRTEAALRRTRPSLRTQPKPAIVDHASVTALDAQLGKDRN